MKNFIRIKFRTVHLLKFLFAQQYLLVLKTVFQSLLDYGSEQ